MDVSSFQINHDTLLRGIYVSRLDEVGNDYVTTFDVRMLEPNREMVMDTSVMHTLEHLMAVYMRGRPDWTDRMIYIGPMGCRTGMYVLFKGNLGSMDVLEIMKDTYQHIVDFNGIVPATISAECGNYLDHNLKMTQLVAKRYLDEVLNNFEKKNMEYPNK
jgi:S-ribosylhomocysteine lyase